LGGSEDFVSLDLSALSQSHKDLLGFAQPIALAWFQSRVRQYFVDHGKYCFQLFLSHVTIPLIGRDAPAP